MVQINGGFDANAHEPMDDFDAVPANDYQLMLVNSKTTSTGKGVNLEFDITAGDFQGRKVWTNLNMFHENPKAVQMALAMLSSLCRAAGRAGINDTSELHGVTVMGKVKLQKDDPTKNDIANFSAMATASHGQGGAPAFQAAVQDAEAAQVSPPPSPTPAPAPPQAGASNPPPAAPWS